MPPPPAPGLQQSTSFHSLEQAHAAWGPGLDYAFLSPVFDSISKAGYAAAGFDPAAVRCAARAPGAPRLIALGGVAAGRLEAVAAMGFAGAAVLGGVWARADPAAAVEELLAECARVAQLQSSGGSNGREAGGDSGGGGGGGGGG
jgi:thiamine-phosphate pyrophosphorylase